MRLCALLLVLAVTASALAQPKRPALVKLTQYDPRAHPKFMPARHQVGPSIPGLVNQGAVPQGLAYWAKQNWLLVSCYLEDRPSVVVALDARTGKLQRCLTLLEPGGTAHTEHVGGLAVSDKYLWVGSGQLYRVPLASILAARPEDYLSLQDPLRAVCTASYVSYHDKRVWVGEFVSLKDGFEGDPTHAMKDRNGTQKYAWIAGYALDDNDNLAGLAQGKRPSTPIILSVRQKIQGMAFLDSRIFLSMSYGRANESTLAAYTNPFPTELKKPHATVKVKGETFNVWCLDGKNRAGEEETLPPMSEGITAYGDRLAILFESGAAKYQKGGLGSIDSVLYLTRPGGK